MKDAHPVWAGGHWKRIRYSGHLASGLPVLAAAVAVTHQPTVRFWLLSDRTQVLILIWDPSPARPVRAEADDDAESGRGLMLVEALSTKWGSYPCLNGALGKVTWALISGGE